MVYLFLGQDSLSKDLQLKKIKQEFLDKSTEQFNLDVLYGKELNLNGLQEKLLCLPVKSKKRIIVIKDAQNLKEEVKEFILKYVKTPPKQLILVLDIRQQSKFDEFVTHLSRYAKTFRFQEVRQPDTFTLSRQITARRPDYALRVLNQILKEGERPERILGGLRYVWEKDTVSPSERRRNLNLLFNCDLEIKTGKLKPIFALEKLVINLCSFSKPFH